MMREYRRYGRRLRYPYHRPFRRGIPVQPRILKFIAVGIVLFVLAAILLHLAR